MRAPCCKRWFDCPQCHAEVSDHPLMKTAEIILACKKCKRTFRKDATYITSKPQLYTYRLFHREGVEESDEYCPHCDNHYVIEAVEPTPMVMFESEDPRFQRDSRMKPNEMHIPEDELLELMA